MGFGDLQHVAWQSRHASLQTPYNQGSLYPHHSHSLKHKPNQFKANMKLSIFVILGTLASAFAAPIPDFRPPLPSDIFKDQRIADSFALAEACFPNLESVECQAAISSHEAKYAYINQQLETNPGHDCLSNPTAPECVWQDFMNGNSAAQDNAIRSACQIPDSPECLAAVRSGF
jgi:hypothetical protein